MTAAYWHNGNFFGVQIVYAPNAQAWKRLMKEYAPADMLDDPFPPHDAHCCTFPNRNDENDQISIVTIDQKRAQTFNMSQVVGMLAHEGTHVWRHTREKIREADPSAEFEAYAIQSITQFLVSVYIQAHKKPWGKLA